MSNTTTRKVEPLVYWVLLAGLSFIAFVIDGNIKTYGLLYLELLDKYDEDPQRTGMAGTGFGVAGLTLGPLNGWLTDYFGSWKIMMVSSVACVTGAIITAFAPSLNMVILGFGVFLGWGVYISFTAAAAAAAKLFIYNRTTAMGIMLGGGSLGVIIYPFLFHYLLEQYTLLGVMLILAGLYFNFVVIASLIFFVEKHCKIRGTVDENIKKIRESDKEEAYKDEEFTDAVGNTKELVNMGCMQVQEYIATERTEPNVCVGLNYKCELNAETIDKAMNNSYVQTQCPSQCLCNLWHLCRPFLTIKFVSFILFHLTFMFGLYGYLMYVPPYLVEIGLTKVQIASLLSIDGVFDLIGRVTIGFVSNHPKVNIYTLIAVNSVISGCFDLILPLMLSTMPVYPVMAANMAVLGLLVGGTIGLHGQLIVNAVGIERAGTGFGLGTTSFGIATSLTAFIYGRLKESSGSYGAVPYLSGGALILCAIILTLGQLYVRFRKIK